MAADSTHCCCRWSTCTAMEKEEEESAMVVTETDSESPDPTLPLPTDASPEAKPMETEDKNKGAPTSNQDQKKHEVLNTSSTPTKKYGMCEGTIDETKYDLNAKGDGLFVSISNEGFSYVHDGEDWKNMKWHYDREIKLLKKTFSFGENDLRRFLPGDDFDDFISDVVDEQKAQPSFLMFFLMSVGFENGTLLMTDRRDITENRRECCEKDHEHDGEKKHKHDGECHERSIIKHVIQRVQGSKRFSGVPKVFIIQMLKRVHADPEPASKGDDTKVRPTAKKPPQADLYIPKGSDTFVLYSCLEMHEKWRFNEDENDDSDDDNEDDNDDDNDDPFIIRAFCNKVQELRGMIPESVTALLNISQILGLPSQDQDGAAKSSSIIIEELNEHLEVMKGYTSLSLTPESLTNSWLTSICQQTTATVLNFIHKKKGEDQYAETELRSLYKDKQRPIISSTLRRGFSMVDLLGKIINK